MSRLRGVRALPWALLLEIAAVASRHWRGLDEGERRRLRELVLESRGRPGNLSARQRAELRRLVGKLDLPGMGREMSPFGAGRKRRG
jgi:hypothetical protein